MSPAAGADLLPDPRGHTKHQDAYRDDQECRGSHSSQEAFDCLHPQTTDKSGMLSAFPLGGDFWAI